jgi:uncharacterized protein (DUF58 family)
VAIPPGGPLTPRGRAALALGALAYLAGWAFGSRPLIVVAVGLLLAVLVAWLAVRMTGRPVELRRTTRTTPLEGEDVQVRVELELDSAVAPAGITLVERFAKLGERRTSLHREGRHLWARYVIETPARGRYALEEAAAVVEDPFGLERVELPLPRQEALVVYPRLVELDRLFTETGTHAREGRRLLLQRPTGFDLHSVRDYVEGDSLRKVHWPTTARRGHLMVKELEDAPRDELAVVLDAHGGSVVGESFDVQVRAAGSIAQAYAQRGRRAALVLGGATIEVQRIHAEGDWRRALELLAAVEPDGADSGARLLSGDRNPAAQALELLVVTARLEAALVERLVQRVSARRNTALVWVDSASFVGRPRQEPALLRLSAAGVSVAAVRAGDDLQTALGASAFGEAAHA